MIKKCMLFFFILSAMNCSFLYSGDDMDSIELSRNSCVKISSKSGNSIGTGFFISEDLIATCFHVIASFSQNGQNINYEIFKDIQITTITGETINASCITPPTTKDPSPLLKDFAILKLSQKPKSLKKNILRLSDKNINTVKIGNVSYYSGYPLSTPALITHKGMISGIDNSRGIICIQGSINKGNSGGALISDDGSVIGIISMREGGISKALKDLTVYIDNTSKQGSSIQMLGVDPLQAIKVTIETLDTFISTGIGYAINIKFLKEYSYNNNILKLD